MFYVLMIIAAMSLAILYKFFPRKKTFGYFCILLFVIFSVSAYFANHQPDKEKITQEQIERIQNQQQIFISWYANYQKNIDALDRNWQLYYKIVDILRTQAVYEKITYDQLVELETAAIEEQIKIHNLNPPPELDEDCRIILTEIITKTQNYSDAQVKVISAVRQIANPETAKNLVELNRQIKNITLREVPAGLFYASEIAEIRNKLILPEEGINK